MPTPRFGFILYRDGPGDWRWRLVSRNGKIVADCAEGYRHKGDALRMVEAIKAGKTADAPIVVPDQAPTQRASLATKGGRMAAKRASLRPTANRASISPATKRTA